MNSGKTRLLAALMSAAVTLSAFAGTAAFAAETDQKTDTASGSTASSGTAVSAEYERYLESLSGYKYAGSDIVINAVDYAEAKGCDYEAVEGGATAGSVLLKKSYDVIADELHSQRQKTDCLVWADNPYFKQQGSIDYVVDVPADGIYNIEFKYLPLNKTGATADTGDDKASNNPVELGVKIDGQTLYAGLDALSLPRMFVNNGASLDVPAGEVRVDTLGNELTPEQVEYGEFVTALATDPVGVVAEPYKILLTAGRHVITIESKYEPFALASVTLKAPADPMSYSDYSAKHTDAKKYDGTAIEIEGEDAWIKSTNSLVSKADNSSSDITPNSPVKTILNYIGSTNWQIPGQSITWVVDVAESGLYRMGMNYKQSAVIDGFTYRSLTIDGEMPFAECSSLRFGYCTSWTFYEFGNGTDPYLFYLEKGKHTLKLTVTLGETSEFYSRLSEIVDSIGDTYIDIVMITSDSPDRNRDYNLFKQIPNFQERLLTMYEDLNNLADDMRELSGSRSNKYISALNNMARILKSMYDNQYSAQTYVTDYYSNYTTVCSWLYEMKTMPLSVDQIQFIAPEGSRTDHHANFFEKVSFSAKRFFASFSDDFSTIAGTAEATDKGQVRIWVNWGRDQAQVLSNLIQDSFTYKTGISVQLEIVSASLVNGILSGNFPDLSLHLSRTDPVNLGMRGALYDLTNFSASKDSKYSTVDDGSNYLLDYETVLKRFRKSADEPYWYENELYSIPDTQSFYIMFYRTDIFDSLGLDDPAKANNGQGWTWSDFLDAATTLQRNNMDAYIPYTKIASTTTVNAGMGSLHLFPTMLTQNNVDLYNADRNATTLTSSNAIAAFTQWTDLYTKYGIIKQADFYNRFRVGTMPLGVASYTQYTQLMQAAPEIQGRWTITEIPGIMQEDGTINRSIGGSGTGCGIVAPSENKDAAWQFLCWWTSAETQLRYNNNVESILGTVSRTATANIEAFNSYSWNADDLDILNSQWEQVKELPEVPGGYYVSRAVDQAYWAVLNGNSNEKDAMLEWGEVADNEIKRKIDEYKKD